MESVENSTDYISLFENTNNYKLPEFLITASRFNDLVHLNQLNDIKNQEFNYICFIGNYSKILKGEHKLLKNKNSVFRDLKNQVFLTNDLGQEKFKPVHTPFSFPCMTVSSFDDVYSGLIIYENYYILVNTDDDNLRYNVYSINKNTCKDTKSDYLFFVLIGKLVNPSPYLLSEVEDFESKYNLKISHKIKTHLTTQIKPIVLNIDGKQKIFYVNLNGNANLYSYLNRPNLLTEESNDLENFRKPLFKIWEKHHLFNESINEEELSNIKKEINNKMEHFFDGFLKIGTIENENYKNIGNDEKTEHKLVVELYMLLNCSEELQGSLWLYHINEPGNATINDVHYLPVSKIFKIGEI